MKKLISLSLIIIIGLLMLANNLHKPFYGHHDFNSAYYSTMAKNYLRYGLKTTKLGQITNSGISESTQFNFHTHYPSTFPLLLALSYKLFGFHEISGRLIPLCFSLASLLLLYLICRRLKFSQLASLASTVVLFTPMMRYFGKLPVHEPLVIFFSLLSALFYLNYLKSHHKKDLLIFLFSALINSLISWPGYFLYPLLVLHSYIYHRKLYKKISLSLLVIAFGLLFHLFHVYLLTGDFFGGGLIKALIFRLNLASPRSDLVQFTLKKYLIQQARWLTVYYTRPLIIISLGLLTHLFFNIIKKKHLTLPESFILVFLLFGLGYPVVFPNMVFIHDYFNIYFLPFLAFSFAFIINQLHRWSSKIAIALFILLTILIATERLAFLKAHQQSNMHLTGYQLGKFINQTYLLMIFLLRLNMLLWLLPIAILT